jgi:hypothetical protein
MINRGKHPEQGEAEAELDGIVCHAGKQTACADADKENHHHPFAAPPVGEPSRRDGA